MLRNMLGAAVSELFSGRPVDAILFASCVILPSICIGCMRQIIASQRISSDFSLRRLESIELNRATLLYERVCNNLKGTSNYDPFSACLTIGAEREPISSIICRQGGFLFVCPPAP